MIGAVSYSIKNKKKMADIFDNPILCKNCGVKMKPATLVRDGFSMRALHCQKCSNKIVHPRDEQEYKEFLQLRNKTFKVKLRLVGNSYAVSIPKEIVEFLNEQEKMMDDMVKLCFENTKKLNLIFN